MSSSPCVDVGMHAVETQPMFEGVLQAADHLLRFGGVTHIMGVVNVSPESENKHTVASSLQEAVDLAERYREWGADLIDVGGQSSHWKNPTIDPARETGRLLPVVEELAGRDFIVSVDTWKPEVAAAAVDAGAAMVNDTGGLRLPAMVEVVTRSTVAVVAVHVDAVHPHDVNEVDQVPAKAKATASDFAGLLDALPPAVVERLVLDPGIAINYRGDYAAYTRLQLEVIRHADEFEGLHRPLLVPIPRKRDIHWVSAYIAMALEHGADMIRVHDVAIAAELTRLWERRVG